MGRRGEPYLRTEPILGGEGKDGECSDAPKARKPDDLLEGPVPGLVASGDGQTLVSGPPGIAIHDDGHVPWQRLPQQA